MSLPPEDEQPPAQDASADTPGDSPPAAEQAGPPVPPVAAGAVASDAPGPGGVRQGDLAARGVLPGHGASGGFGTDAGERLDAGAGSPPEGPWRVAPDQPVSGAAHAAVPGAPTGTVAGALDQPVPGALPGPAPVGEPAVVLALDAPGPGGTPPAAEDPPPAADRDPPVRRTRLQRFRGWRFAPFFEVLITIGIALGLAESVQAAIVKPFVIPTGSMEPTLEPSQRVLVNRLAYDFGSPQRGDIVVFHPPSSLSCADAKAPVDEPCPKSVSTPSSQYFVKRILGLPGDHLRIKDGHPVINGHEVTDEPYITQCGNVPACNMPIVITIPKGEYFMLGDNRGDSDDSRYWGPIPATWIVGEVFATYWPPDRIGIF